MKIKHFMILNITQIKNTNKMMKIIIYQMKYILKVKLQINNLIKEFKI
jgi:hypothetical protein